MVVGLETHVYLAVSGQWEQPVFAWAYYRYELDFLESMKAVDVVRV